MNAFLQSAQRLLRTRSGIGATVAVPILVLLLLAMLVLPLPPWLLDLLLSLIHI